MYAMKFFAPVAAVLLAGVACSGATAAPSFTLVPPIPGSTDSIVGGVSDDGKIVGGYSDTAGSAAAFQSFLWDGEEHRVLRTPPGFFSMGGFLHALSGDGRSAVGWGYHTDREAFRGARWFPSGHPSGLGAPQGESSYMGGLNYDGSVAVGSKGGNSANPLSTPVVWRTGAPLIELGRPDGTTGWTTLHATNNAGDRHVGEAEIHGMRRPILWEEPGGFRVLPWSETGSGAGVAQAISSGGDRIVGRLEIDGRYHPAFWDESLTPHIIDIHPDYEHGEALALADDGSTIIGVWSDRLSSPIQGHSSLDLAFIWDEVNGARPLQDVLIQDYGLDLDGWNLHAAVDITPDGQTIVGMARIDFGPFMGFKVVLPAPGVLPVLLLGGLAACRRRR